MSTAPDFSPAFRSVLRDYCAAQYGRQAELARYLGVPPQRVNDYVRGIVKPTHGQTLAVLAWLPKAERRRILSNTNQTAE